MCATQFPADAQPVVVHRVWPAQPQTPYAARKLIGESLATVGLADHPDVEHLQLAVSEAVSNAVEHAYPATHTNPAVDATVELTLKIEQDLVSIVIADRGSWRDPPRQPGFRGRGLTIMRAIVDFLEIHHDGTGTKVILRHPLPAT